MKGLLTLGVVLLAALTVSAQSTGTTNILARKVSAAAPTNSVLSGFEAQHGVLNPQSALVLTPLRPNQIVKGNTVLSGIGVEVYKTRRPLQLLNPLAGPEYGSPEDNVMRDPINGRVTGLKLFAIRF